jgi:hypothetical protein
LFEKVPGQKFDASMKGTQIGKAKEPDKSHGKGNGHFEEKEEDEQEDSNDTYVNWIHD